MVVWIYDEDGYPSGAAGGLVLEKNPKFEALALAYDPSSNNVYAARRFPNLLDAKAVDYFIEVTHEAYWKRLEEHFGKAIKALFTDEPSLMATNIGQIPAHIRKNVRTIDPVDESVKPLPSVPWVADLPEKYRQRYGGNLVSVRKSLFVGDDERDKRVRRQYWSLVTDLLAERYYGKLQKWAGQHRVASSGHLLSEEQLVHAVSLEGNPLKMLMRMDIPGLDMLNSNPEAVIHTGWLTASLPGSAAVFNGGRRVMTEVSDFSQQMAGKGHVSLAEMCATAAWQAAMGVTEFTLYYNRSKRTAADYRAYCDYVGRLNALLREARPEPRVLLYYPIYDAWGEFLPVAEKLTVDSQSQRMKKVVNSFMSLGRGLTRRQIPFALVDHELLAGASIRESELLIQGRPFSVLVLPTGVELPRAAAEQVDRFKAGGGRVVKDAGGIDWSCFGRRVSGAPDRVVVGCFVRDHREILAIVNVAGPATGRIEAAKREGDDKIRVDLPPQSALLLIGPVRPATGDCG